LELIQSRQQLSLVVLIRILLFSIIIGMLFYWRSDDIYSFYFDDQTTNVGLIVNGAILCLFLSGFIQVVLRLTFYVKEDKATVRFVSNLKQNPKSPLAGVPEQSLIALRYKIIKSLFEQRTPFQQGSAASALMASESGKNSLLKYINNVLILIGVFGTIVSLSIALVGASNLLDTMNGMGLIIHGMSTALSTTMTAIVCFFFFSYLYTHVMDVQTNLISSIEQVTTTYLLPRYQVQTDTLLFEVSGLIRTLQTVTNNLSDSHERLAHIESNIDTAISQYLEESKNRESELSQIKSILRQGFRLPEPS
jgi:hypothetical protein